MSDYCEVCNSRGQMSPSVTECDKCRRPVCYLHLGSKFDKSPETLCVDCKPARS